MPTDVDSLSFPAVQTYSSGEEVAWIQATPEGGEEPEHPAPTVHLVDAPTGGASTATTVAVGSTLPQTTAAPATSASNDSDSSNALAIVALIVAVVALLGAAAAVAAASLVGVAAVSMRLAEFTVLRRFDPLATTRVATLLHPLGAAILLIFGPAAGAAFALGQIGWAAIVKYYRERGQLTTNPKFGHGVQHRLPDGVVLLASFHPSQQNTFTGKLTEAMFDRVFAAARRLLEASQT